MPFPTATAADLLNAWVYAIAVEDWRDLGVIITSDQMNHLECSRESRGHASIGWDCIFTPMPHLCIFDSDEVRVKAVKVLA